MEGEKTKRRIDFELNGDLLEACLKGKMHDVNKLIRLGANVNWQLEDGETCLMLAVECKIKESVKQLLLCNDINVNIRDKLGGTALSSAAFRLIEILQLLLDHQDIVVDIKDNDGWTPLTYAFINNKPENAKLLIAKGADGAHACKILLEWGTQKINNETKQVFENWKQYLPEWTMWNHHCFPEDFKKIVVVWLLVVAKQKYIRKCINKDMRRHMVQFIAAAYKNK